MLWFRLWPCSSPVAHGKGHGSRPRFARYFVCVSPPCFPTLLLSCMSRNAERGSLAHLCQPTGIWIKFLYRRDELVLSAIFYIMAMEFLLHCHATCRHADLFVLGLSNML